jgi:outer membrane PBP1 activator LpoA protein
MPWVIQNIGSLNTNLQAIYKQIMETVLWANSFANYKKFYALGVDAYNLAMELNALSQGGIEGASGTLHLDKFNHIYRELQWAEMKNGVAQNL